MKIKQKTKYGKVFLPLALLIFLAVFFVSSFSRASGSHVVINEIMTADENSTKDEFIELYNQSDQAVVLDKFRLTKKTVSGNESTLVSAAKFVGTIEPHGYFVIAYPDLKNTIGADLAYSSASYSIASSNTVLLYDADGKILDKVGFGLASDVESIGAQNPEDGNSIGRIDGRDTDDNGQDFTIQNPSPGKENKKMEEKLSDPPKTYSDKIQITELFPYPFQAQYEEYVELFNGASEDVDLIGWTLHDASISGKYVFPESVIVKSKKYLAIFKKDFGFVLNNSGDELVTLLDPNGSEISEVAYDGSTKNLSYNFDGSRWRWSKFLTPGQENILNNEPYGTLKVDDEVFENVYADFSISTGDVDGDKVSVTWDFGDGHKSYLAKTRHKYVEVGKYVGSAKLSDGSEDVVKNFTVEVNQYPHPKIRIVAINANPDGSDTGIESLTIQNKSKKKINLNGWSIATGWKKFINHPIREDLVIKKGKVAEVTHEVSSFTLNNVKAKVQLRYPDGKVAQEVKYKKTEGVEEGEIYQKVKGGWAWLRKISNEKLQIPDKIQDTKDNEQNTITINNSQNTIDNEQKTVNSEQESTDNEQETGSSDQESTSRLQDIIGEQNQKRKNKILENDEKLIKIELLKSWPQVLGAESVREVDGRYFFTLQTEHRHYAVVFLENCLSAMNLQINALLTYLLSR